ncbi:MAG: hypothetical protein AB1760_20110 [Pseudomonadota bacterium]
MKTSEIDLAFPVIGFTVDEDVWGFRDLRGLTTCGRRTLKKGMQDGMELVDSRGARWRVSGIEKLGPSDPWWAWLIGQPLYRIAQEVEPLPPLSLAEIQDRVCAAMLAHPLFWCVEEDQDTEIAVRTAELRAVTSVADFFDIMDIDTFENY